MARLHLGPIQRALVVEQPDPSLDALLAAGGIDVHRFEGSPDESALIELLQAHKSQVVFKRSKVVVSRAVIEACPELLAVQLCCIGDDSVDKQAAADHGLMVFNDPVSNGRSVVELVIGHLIALSRRLYETDTTCRQGLWEKSNAERYEVRGKTLGIWGLGNIGRGVARAAEALGLKIVFFDTREVSVELGQEFGWTYAANPEALFRASDCVTVHLSARDVRGQSNAGVISRALLDQLGADRPDDSPRVFLNLSRGFLHTTEALLGAVADGRVRRAAIDVYPEEPGLGETWTNPYAAEPRIAVTPHIGASTREAQPRIARRVASTFLAWSQQGAVRDCVYRPRLRLGVADAGSKARAVLVVTHADVRGTKRAIDDVIYDAGASNLASAHHDFADLDFAYDLAALDQPLPEGALERLVHVAAEATGDTRAIRSARQILLD